MAQYDVSLATRDVIGTGEYKCGTCNVTRFITEFYIRPDGKPYSRCKQCRKRWHKTHYNNNINKERLRSKEKQQHRRLIDKEGLNSRARELNKQRRTEILAAYGAFCHCCGESEERFLTLEHLNHDGAIHRNRNKKYGPSSKNATKIYRELIKKGFPKEYTILCWNCNLAERYGEPCPHKIGSQ